MKRVLLIFPFIIFFILILFLFHGLFLNTNDLVPPVLIGKAFPKFTLPIVDNPRTYVTEGNLKGHPALINIWSTLCSSCKLEHGELIKIAKKGVIIYGINYKDPSNTAYKWLKTNGNPYILNISDIKGTLCLDLGVYGTPETYVIDKNGIIHYKIIGVINNKIWNERVAPIYYKLIAEMDTE